MTKKTSPTKVCVEVFDWAQARIDELIGLTEAKERFTLWRKALESDGGTVLSGADNQMVFLGAPGTARKTFARVIGEGLFGLGMITRPTVIEINANDIAVGGLSRSAVRMRSPCCRPAWRNTATNSSSSPPVTPAPCTTSSPPTPG
ncbi:hypothetical protein H7H82_03045 [Mycobacterium heidelbergense]|uniref:hypothetical protein n=1 Tax=Mycobacterium heidelbergense TaxID=53376 RepID=UPI0011503956|nr:hypothetical protein [Mycobacterium heidelbergense]MCV7049590.1 hypothetical protein [Mycobacterium heidelbergense]